MKKIKFILAVAITLGLGVFITNLVTQKSAPKSLTEAKSNNSQKIVLNALDKSASGEQVSDVELEGFDESFNVDTKIYKIENADYSDSDIKKIVKTLDSKITEKDVSNEDTTEYELEDGSYLAYYENSGGIIYIGDFNEVDGVDIKKFNVKKCKKVADAFIKKSDIIDFSDLEYQDASIGESVETENGTEVLSYVLTYKKNSPNDSIDFYGVGPGIRIEIDSNYEVCGFTAVNKEIVEAAGEFETINKNELIDKVCDGKDVQIDGYSDGETLGVSINNMKICLYSDPLTVEQEYMAPYYVLEGEDTNNNDITIVVPAVEDESIIYK